MGELYYLYTLSETIDEGGASVGDNSTTDYMYIDTAYVFLQVKLKTGYHTIGTIATSVRYNEPIRFNGHTFSGCIASGIGSNHYGVFDGQRVDRWWSYREKAK